MEREKRYIKLEQREFFSIINEYEDKILYNKPLYEIIIARIKKFKFKMLCRKFARKLTRKGI